MSKIKKSPFGTERYNSYRRYINQIYGERIQKVTVDAGFTCPNRDGSIGVGGCTYCNNESFNPGYNSPCTSIREQIEAGMQFLKKRYKVNKFLVYFQPYSNTYAPLDRLQQLYDEALSVPGVIGLTIGTRPDCIDAEKINYLANLSKSCDITIEYGLESIYDSSLKRINRGHDYKAFLHTLQMTKEREIKLAIHLILGLPWETKSQWLYEAAVLSELPIDFLKLHQLHIVKDTIMAEQHNKRPFRLLTYSEYVDVIVSFLERLNPKIVLQRLCGEAPPHILIAPRWGKRSSEIQQNIIEQLKLRNTWQGKYYQNS
jgi:radical SAM protein (TIGR01212 family)